MRVILVFLVLVVITQSISVGAAIAAEQISEFVGLMVFFAMYGLGFVVSWAGAVFIAEKYLIKDQPQDPDSSAASRAN